MTPALPNPQIKCLPYYTYITVQSKLAHVLLASCTTYRTTLIPSRPPLLSGHRHQANDSSYGSSYSMDRGAGSPKKPQDRYSSSSSSSLFSTSPLSRVSATLSVAVFAVASVVSVVGLSYGKTMSLRASRLAVGKLYPPMTAVLLCDVQERFAPLIYHSETVIQTCRYMTSVAKELGIPVIATQQYTKAFGPTVKECFATPEDLEATPIFEKKLFSMITPEVQHKLNELERDTYVIMGIEAHVCVQQTCLDLIEQGKNVHLIVDGVSSQQVIDREIALQRLQAAGVFLTTAQSAAFMLMQTAEHRNFKAVSKLTVDHMKLKNQFNEDLLKRVGS